MSDQSLLSMAQSCPRCHRGPLFKGFIAMHPTCPNCGLHYELEVGQHWGSMVLAYLFGALLAFALFLAMLISQGPTWFALLVPVVALAAVAPLNVRVSRLVWTHVMFHLHKGQRQ